MSVVVSNTSPSLLPYIKIRENPHVTAEEWLWLRRVGSAGGDHVGSQGSAGGVGNQPPRGQQVLASVFRIQIGYGIRIRIQQGKNDPQK
jgi:hypothetical protein